MIRTEMFETATVSGTPFPHVIASNVLPPDREDALEADFPEISYSGFLPVETLEYGESFAELIEDLRSPEFAALVGEKLGRELDPNAVLITIRKWSALKDGPVHTDGADKVATALVYMNRAWADSTGRFRVLYEKDLEGPVAAEVAPTYGNFVAFLRSDNSFHGHLPFDGERRVVQIAWLTGADALTRKQGRHKRNSLMKSIGGLFGRRSG